jgi:hypothetical protein
MRKLYFLLPGTGGKFACGGLWAELKTVNLAQQICEAEVVTYRQREKDTLFLDDVLQEKHLEQVIFVMSWGFDVAKLATRLQSHHAIYHAHSAGYRLKLPPNVPIVAVSRHTMGYWGQQAPNSLIYYLPNQISDAFQNRQGDRDIDVLVQTRKSSEYLLKDLIPALQQQCNVCIVDSYVDDLPGLFNRAKVYLYDSAEYWALQGVTEGFGLQPMEAMACGCQVFSSLNGGLADYLDPGFNCYKIAGYSKEFDVQRIMNAIKNSSTLQVNSQLFDEYRAENVTRHLRVILHEVNDFFDHTNNHSTNIPTLTSARMIKLFVKRVTTKLKKLLK